MLSEIEMESAAQTVDRVAGTVNTIEVDGVDVVYYEM
jgi:hypothetical protein